MRMQRKGEGKQEKGICAELGVLAAFCWLTLDFISRMLFSSNIHGFPEASHCNTHSLSFQ